MPSDSVRTIKVMDFDDYFAGCEKGYCYELGKVTVFDTPKELSEFGIKRAPQNFCYVRNFDND